MILSDLCITRPVLATVMSLLIVLAGTAAFLSIPVREYPDIDNPVVSITTTYVGASPTTVESTLTEPLEQSLNGIEGGAQYHVDQRFQSQFDYRRVCCWPRY